MAQFSFNPDKTEQGSKVNDSSLKEAAQNIADAKRIELVGIAQAESESKKLQGDYSGGYVILGSDSVKL